MFFGILCEWWFGFTSLLCQPVVWWLIFSYFEQILTGKLPFYDSHLNDLVIVQIQDGERPERAMYPPTTFTDPMWDLLVDCWDQDPKRRLDMGTVVQRLQHMWWAVCFQVTLRFRLLPQLCFSCLVTGFLIFVPWYPIISDPSLFHFFDNSPENIYPCLSFGNNLNTVVGNNVLFLYF
jgi:hypothetical protein